VTPTVFLIDDDPSVLRGIGRLLKAHGHTVEAFASPAEFLAKFRPDRPGCVLADVQMPGMTGLDLQQALASAGDALPIVFISGVADIPAAARAFKGGAVDFLPKPVEESGLMAAIEAALARDAARRSIRDRFAALTVREREVCLMVARGLPNKQIAFELQIAEKTVKVHRARAVAKLGVESVAALVRLVDQLGAGLG
jgi:FixJ family two-component response regulator